MSADRRGPLGGIRVLDLGTALAGPLAASYLGALGAEVVRLEPPSGDVVHPVGSPIGGIGSWYLGSNFSKQVVTVDLRATGATAAILDALPSFDVLIENRRPGALQRLGLGPAEAFDRAPSLVYASSTGFGRGGPWTDLPAGDLLMQPMAGLASLTGSDGGPEVNRYVAHIDWSSGLAIALGALLGLDRRASSGRGCHVETSLLEVALHLQRQEIEAALRDRRVPEPMSSRARRGPASACHRTLDDRWMAVSIPDEASWARLIDIAGAHLGDVDAATLLACPPSDSERRAHLVARLVGSAPAWYWSSRLRSASIPCHVVARAYEAVATMVDQGRAVRVESPWGAHWLPRSPASLDGRRFDPGPSSERGVEAGGITPRPVVSGPSLPSVRLGQLRVELAGTSAPARLLHGLLHALGVRSDDTSEPNDDRRRVVITDAGARTAPEAPRQGDITVVFDNRLSAESESESDPVELTELEWQARSGMLEYLGDRASEPVRLGYDAVAAAAADIAMLALLASLYDDVARIEVCLDDVVASMLHYAVGPLSSADAYVGPMVTGPDDPPLRGLAARDRNVTFSILAGDLAAGRRTWEKVIGALGVTHLDDDPYWREHGPRLMTIGHEALRIQPLIEPALANWDGADLMHLIVGAGGTAAVFNTYSDLFLAPHEHIDSLAMLSSKDHDGTVDMPWRIDGVRSRCSGATGVDG